MKMTVLAACEACAKMRMANCCDVKITESIMSGIAWIVAICVGGYVVMKLIDACSKACQEKRKKKWEENEANRKRDREQLDRELAEKEAERRRNIELLDKKLEIMKELCYKPVMREETNDDKTTKQYVDVLKSFDDKSKDIENYLSALEAARQNKS